MLLHGANRYRPVGALLRAASRLGDGLFWYLLMAVLVLTEGGRGLIAAAQMLVTALVGLSIYRWLKRATARPRPYTVSNAIRPGAPVLDRYSFPSGHTLHAVAFTVVATAWFPALAVLLVPFALLVALSRPMLGLHYPSDVAAGALIGLAVASLSLVCVGP